MHSLRFPNSGIKAKKDGRLATARPPAGAIGHNLATCKGVVGCGQGPLHRGDWLRPRPPTQGATGYGRPARVAGTCGHGRLYRDAHKDDRLQGDAHKGQSLVASPQGAAHPRRGRRGRLGRKGQLPTARPQGQRPPRRGAVLAAYVRAVVAAMT
ncbi:hypothetical protein GW17_00033742 [Ensete ventricosum]|nr:hypothetical protein GW17_00033742 [Ensete ventricosum]